MKWKPATPMKIKASSARNRTFRLNRAFTAAIVRPCDAQRKQKGPSSVGDGRWRRLATLEVSSGCPTCKLPIQPGWAAEWLGRGESMKIDDRKRFRVSDRGGKASFLYRAYEC